MSSARNASENSAWIQDAVPDRVKNILNRLNDRDQEMSESDRCLRLRLQLLVNDSCIKRRLNSRRSEDVSSVSRRRRLASDTAIWLAAATASASEILSFGQFRVVGIRSYEDEEQSPPCATWDT